MNFLTNVQLTMIQNIGQQGQNSQVVRVHDPQLNREIAVKVIKKASFTNPQEYFEEARILHDSKHTHVVDISFASFDANHVFIAMPLYPQGSLKTLLDNRFLTVREIVKLAVDFISGLHHIHTKGLIHFDIKPSNILLDDTGKALIADFGLAKYTDHLGLAAQGRVYGKHVVPESMVVADRTIQSDIFQTGMTLYRMCNGESKFDQECSAYDFSSLPGLQDVVKDINAGKFPYKEYLPHIPRTLRMIINRALNADPDKRQQTALELLNEIANVSTNLDWIYEVHPNLHKWTRETSLNVVTIEILKHSNSNFEVKVVKYVRASGNTINDNQNSLKNIENLKKSISHVDKVIRELE